MQYLRVYLPLASISQNRALAQSIFVIGSACVSYLPKRFCEGKRSRQLSGEHRHNIELYNKDCAAGWICLFRISKPCICFNIRSIDMELCWLTIYRTDYISDLMCKYSLCSYCGKSIVMLYNLHYVKQSKNILCIIPSDRNAPLFISTVF